jgi:hypothetical protein
MSEDTTIPNEFAWLRFLTDAYPKQELMREWIRKGGRHGASSVANFGARYVGNESGLRQSLINFGIARESIYLILEKSLKLSSLIKVYGITLEDGSHIGHSVALGEENYGKNPLKNLKMLGRLKDKLTTRGT